MPVWELLTLEVEQGQLSEEHRGVQTMENELEHRSSDGKSKGSLS
jgi:hypothetical protein